MCIVNFLPQLFGYLLKRWRFHRQGYGREWDQGMHEAFNLLKRGALNKRKFCLHDLPHYLKMEVWLIWNFFRYLWYRLVVVKFEKITKTLGAIFHHLHSAFFSFMRCQGS